MKLVTTSVATSNNIWILDSGASQHFCWSAEMLFETQQSKLTHVSLADGSKAAVQCERTVQIPESGSVFCVFKLDNNLMSVSVLAKVGLALLLPRKAAQYQQGARCC